ALRAGRGFLPSSVGPHSCVWAGWDDRTAGHAVAAADPWPEWRPPPPRCALRWNGQRVVARVDDSWPGVAEPPLSSAPLVPPPADAGPGSIGPSNTIQNRGRAGHTPDTAPSATGLPNRRQRTQPSC